METDMRKTLWKAGLSAAALLLMSSSAFAQTTATLNVNLTVAARARLTLSTTSITLPDLDPTTNPTLSAPAVDVNVAARTTPTNNWNLTVQATGDLTGTGGTIAIANLTWAGSGSGFNATGTSNSATPQTVGAWTGSGAFTGAQTYSIPNSWAYGVGNYATALNYTLTVP
jgi:hypothetical protein